MADIDAIRARHANRAGALSDIGDLLALVDARDATIARLRAALEAARIEHLEEGYRCLAYTYSEKDCDCGANEHNARIDAALGETVDGH